MSNKQSAFQILSEELEGWLSADELRTLRKNEASGGTLADFSTALKKAYRQNLDPLQDHVFFLSNYHKQKGREVLSLGISIAGLRSIAQSTGEYAGQKGPFWCDQSGEWTDVWLSDEPPAAAKVGVMRQSFKEPLWNVARWDDYAAMKNGSPMFMWADMGPHMLAKCCEANALRRAFPDRVSELYIPEEMEKQQESESSGGEKTDETLNQLRQATGETPDADGRPEAGMDTAPDEKGPPGDVSGSRPTGDDGAGRGRPDGRPARHEKAADGPEREDASGAPVGGVSGTQNGASGQAGQPAGDEPDAPQGGQAAPEDAQEDSMTISTGDGSQLNLLFAKGVHDGPYTKEGLKQMVEQEFGVSSIDALMRDDFDDAVDRLGNEQLAARYNKQASGKAGTGALDFSDSSSEQDDSDSPSSDTSDTSDSSGEVDVDCPYCGASAGEPCQNDDGEPVDYYHKDREERFKMHAGDVGAYISQMEKALDQAGGEENALEIIRAVAVDIDGWPDEDWEEVVSRLEHFHDDAREECELRRTPDFK